jgi:prepilin-type N-terminal cleavage/methylation domain-containing protein
MSAAFLRTSYAARPADGGFSLIELMIAILVLVTGMMALIQLVPTATRTNLSNRADSSSMVYAQRELNQMMDQPVTVSSFTDADGTVCQLGSLATAGKLAGSPVITVAGNLTRIDFTQPSVSGYSLTLIDPNDPNGISYDVRWAVLVNAQGTQVSAKRLIVGAQRRVSNNLFPPVSVDAWVQR